MGLHRYHIVFCDMVSMQVYKALETQLFLEVVT